MPEYLAPGVFVEEVSFRSKSIEGVSTTTTGFIGPVRYGPVTEPPDVVTSLSEFERSYGDGRRLVQRRWRARESQLHVARRTLPSSKRVANEYTSAASSGPCLAAIRRPTWQPRRLAPNLTPTATGAFGRQLAGDSASSPVIPGAAGNLRLRFGLKLGPNVLGALPDPTLTNQFIPTISNLQVGDVVWIASAQAFAAVLH
jgi:phage tail sheath protein FI